jgi:hypothetical protein
MLKNPQSRWFDRSNVYIVTRDGVVVTNGDVNRIYLIEIYFKDYLSLAFSL